MDRLPPHDNPTEDALIGAILVDPSLLPLVQEILQQGEHKASLKASFTMTEVRKKIGLLTF